jgi:hypothetical protein
MAMANQDRLAANRDNNLQWGSNAVHRVNFGGVRLAYFSDVNAGTIAAQRPQNAVPVVNSGAGCGDDTVAGDNGIFGFGCS